MCRFPGQISWKCPGSSAKTHIVSLQLSDLAQLVGQEEYSNWSGLSVHSKQSDRIPLANHFFLSGESTKGHVLPEAACAVLFERATLLEGCCPLFKACEDRC